MHEHLFFFPRSYHLPVCRFIIQSMNPIESLTKKKEENLNILIISRSSLKYVESTFRILSLCTIHTYCALNLKKPVKVNIVCVVMPKISCNILTVREMRRLGEKWQNIAQKSSVSHETRKIWKCLNSLVLCCQVGIERRCKII